MADEPYFSLPEIRQLPDILPDRYPDPMVDLARGWIEQIIERTCRTSFVYREKTETITREIQPAAGQLGLVGVSSGYGYGWPTGGDISSLFLSSLYVRSVSAVSVDGVPLSADDLAALRIRKGGILRWPVTTSCGWAGSEDVTVTYLAGYSETPPGDIKAAAMQAVRYRLLTFYNGKSGPSDRMMSMSTEQGTTQYSTASPEGRPTGLPEVDAVIVGWARELNAVGVL